MLSNLSVFPPWIMLLVLCLKIGGKFMAPRSFPSAAPPLPQQMGLKRWENQEYGRILDPLTGLSCVCVYGCSVESDSFRPHGLQPTRLLCPWDFSRQEYWRRLPFPPSEDLPHPGIEPVFPTSLVSPTLASRFFTTAQPGKPCPNYSFPLSRTAYKWSHTICRPLRLLSFTSPYAFKVHSHHPWTVKKGN